jgi:hypothetical protein
MDCTQIRELLGEYVDDQMSAAQAEPVKQHLAACSSCRDEASALSETMRLLQEWPAIEPPSSFVDDVVAAATLDETLGAWSHELEPGPAFTSRVMAAVQADEKAELDSFEELDPLLHTWSALEPSNDFVIRVMAEVGAPAAQGSATQAPADTRASKIVPLRQPARLLYLRPSFVSRVAAIAAVFVLTVGVFMLRQPPPAPQAPPLDEFVTSWDMGRQAVVIHDMPDYVASTSKESDLLPVFEEHSPTQKVSPDDILKEMLTQSDDT